MNNIAAHNQYWGNGHGELVKRFVEELRIIRLLISFFARGSLSIFSY